MDQSLYILARSTLESLPITSSKLDQALWWNIAQTKTHTAIINNLLVSVRNARQNHDALDHLVWKITAPGGFVRYCIANPEYGASMIVPSSYISIRIDT
jgi:hypothetical protein